MGHNTPACMLEPDRIASFLRGSRSTFANPWPVGTRAGRLVEVGGFGRFGVTRDATAPALMLEPVRSGSFLLPNRSALAAPGPRVTRSGRLVEVGGFGGLIVTLDVTAFALIFAPVRSNSFLRGN